MAKTTASRKKQKRSFWQTVLDHKVIAGIVLVAIIVVAFLSVSALVEHRAQQKERQQFAQAQSDLRNIYSDIARQIGRPNRYAFPQTCSRTNVEFGKGFLGCEDRAYLAYTVINLNDAKNLKDEISQTVKNSSKVRNFRLVNWTSQGDGYEQIGSDSFRLATIPGCGTDYWYLTSGLPPYEQIPFSVGSSTLLVGFNCSAPARAEYFPVTN